MFSQLTDETVQLGFRLKGGPVPLFHGDAVRRFVGFAVLFFLAAPLSISVIGCGHKTAQAQYCNAGDSGPTVGQVASISLSPTLATVGESLNYAQMGQTLSATAEDCKGNSVSVRSFVYASTSSYNVNNANSVFADINPSNGQVCGGTWNRNTGGGVPDYTLCTAPAETPVSTSAALSVASTAATASIGSTITLQLAQSTDLIAGTLTLALGTGPAHSITVAPVPLSSLAAQINGDSTFMSEGISASFNANTTVLTITGPVGVNNTLVTTGTSTPSVPATSISDDTVAFLAFVTATAQGVVSNAVPVYVHPKATGIVLGGATPGALNGSCPAGTVDPGTDCCPNSTVGTPIQAPVYTGAGCLSQTGQGQLIARVYANGTTSPANNITCQVGHISYASQSGAGIVTIDQNGVATANQPGSTEITATLAGSSTGTNAGFFSTCPPQKIVLSINGQPAGTNSVNVNLNNSQPLTATVTDTNGHTITGLNLEFNSTAPQNIPAGSGSITPTYPGSADITAVCQPSTCNVAPFSQIGLYGNGEPLTSNAITVTSTGTSSTVLYMASSPDPRTGSPGSLYVTPYDFTVGQPSTPIKLQFVPNSMVINQAGTEVYLGSTQGLVTINTANNSASAPNTNIPGTVLSVSPDGTQLVVTDTARQTVSLVATSNGTVNTSYGGTATSAVWTPDSQAVYITLAATTAYPTPTLLQYSLFTKWQVVAPLDEVYTAATVTVPSVGAYFAGANNTEGRSYCPAGTQASTGPPPVINNSFAPSADTQAVPNDALFATSDGLHILGAHAVNGTGNSVLNDLEVTLPTTTPCPQPPVTSSNSVKFTSTPFKKFLTGINASAITGVYAGSNSAAAFVTYIGSSGFLPLYLPASTGVGTLTNVPLASGTAGTPTAPISGVFSTDNFSFYTGTTGDNAVHIITLTYPSGGTPTAVDSGATLTPALPAASGSGSAPVNLIVQYPKKAKS
jgi:hypothetical protein